MVVSLMFEFEKGKLENWGTKIEMEIDFFKKFI